MKKEKLEVRPARKIYNPKYPSYEDKNPLLNPDSRPYPFNQKIINWISMGGLAGAMMFAGNDALAQTRSDSLYNPFPLTNAAVPYRPVSFGTGMPSRLRSEEAIEVIMKAFLDSGMSLEKNVWLKDKPGIKLTGYNRKEELGFLFIDYENMDHSFIDKDYYQGRHQYDSRKIRLKVEVENYKKQRDNAFDRFVRDKSNTIERLKNRYKRSVAEQEYIDQLSILEPNRKSQEEFYKLYLQRDLTICREDLIAYKVVDEIHEHIDQRIGENSIEKYFLLLYSKSFNPRFHGSDVFDLRLKEEFIKLKRITSNKKFVKNYLALIDFMEYNGNQPKLRDDEDYIKIKLDIMNSYPLKEWVKNRQALDQYQDHHFISLNEARQLDKENELGNQFIAPISQRDPSMIITNSSWLQPNPYDIEYRELRKEYQEYINSKKPTSFEWEEDPKEKEYLKRLEELKIKIQEWYEQKSVEDRWQTLRNLEKQVKMYIKWARSQMGG